jgi:hypothetical protein
MEDDRAGRAASTTSHSDIRGLPRLGQSLHDRASSGGRGSRRGRPESLHGLLAGASSAIRFRSQWIDSLQWAGLSQRIDFSQWIDASQRIDPARWNDFSQNDFGPVGRSGIGVGISPGAEPSSIVRRQYDSLSAQWAPGSSENHTGPFVFREAPRAGSPFRFAFRVPISAAFFELRIRGSGPRHSGTWREK